MRYQEEVVRDSDGSWRLRCIEFYDPEECIEFPEGREGYSETLYLREGWLYRWNNSKVCRVPESGYVAVYRTLIPKQGPEGADFVT